jgi:hypothetical protein
MASKDMILQHLDADKSGAIDAREFAVLYDAIKKDLEEELSHQAALEKEASSATRKFKMLLLFVAVLVSFLAASVAANFAVLFTFVDSAITTATTTSGLLQAKGSDSIVKTAIATQDVPLMAAPALDIDTLSEVKSLKVVYRSVAGERIEAQMTVVGVRKHNSTFVEFVTSVGGETVEALNGVASLVRYPSSSNRLTTPIKHVVCSANATCSAFKTTGVDVAAALELARSELKISGFLREARRLAPAVQESDCHAGWWTWSACGIFGGLLCPAFSVMNAVSYYYSGYSWFATRHVVFFLHGWGAHAAHMWSMYCTFGVLWCPILELNEFRHLVFVFPTSFINGYLPAQTLSNGHTLAGGWGLAWGNPLDNSLKFEQGADALAMLMCGNANAFELGWCWGFGWLSLFGVDSSSEVMLIGFSNGGGMAAYGNFAYGTTITKSVAIDYHASSDYNVWMPAVYAASGAVGLNLKLYEACDSWTFSTDGILSSPSYGSAGQTFFADPPAYKQYGGFGFGYLPYKEFAFSEQPGGTGRKFVWAVHGWNPSNECTNNRMCMGCGKNMIHLAVPYFVGIIGDVLDWLEPAGLLSFGHAFGELSMHEFGEPAHKVPAPAPPPFPPASTWFGGIKPLSNNLVGSSPFSDSVFRPDKVDKTTVMRVVDHYYGAYSKYGQQVTNDLESPDKLWKYSMKILLSSHTQRQALTAGANTDFYDLLAFERQMAQAAQMCVPTERRRLKAVNDMFYKNMEKANAAEQASLFNDVVMQGKAVYENGDKDKAGEELGLLEQAHNHVLTVQALEKHMMLLGLSGSQQYAESALGHQITHSAMYEASVKMSKDYGYIDEEEGKDVYKYRMDDADQLELNRLNQETVLANLHKQGGDAEVCFETGNIAACARFEAAELALFNSMAGPPPSTAAPPPPNTAVVIENGFVTEVICTPASMHLPGCAGEAETCDGTVETVDVRSETFKIAGSKMKDLRLILESQLGPKTTFQLFNLKSWDSRKIKSGQFSTDGCATSAEKTIALKDSKMKEGQYTWGCVEMGDYETQVEKMEEDAVIGDEMNNPFKAAAHNVFKAVELSNKPLLACFSQETTACRLLSPVAAKEAHAACFGSGVGPAVAERVSMDKLVAGDAVLADEATVTRVVVNQHAGVKAAAPMLTLHFEGGSLSLTADHVLLLDGVPSAARLAAVGSVLSSGRKVSAVTHGSQTVVNPITAAGTILAADASGEPVVAATANEWLADVLLSAYPKYTLSFKLAAVFPASVQAFYNSALEPFFSLAAPHLQHVKAAAPPTAIIAGLALGDTVLAAGLVAYALGKLALVTAVAVAASRFSRKA